MFYEEERDLGKTWAKFEPENERIEIISILAAYTTQTPPAALIYYINGATGQQ